MKNLLLATDLTARCDRAFDRAVLLARERDAKLGLLHVVPPAQAGSELSDAQIRERILSDIGDAPVAVEILIGRGSVPETIARIAAEQASDIIITGVARYNNLGDFLLGTAVDHIVRHAGVPVLVVKQRAHRSYQSLLVATDFSPCSLVALKAAAEQFPQTTLNLVHAYHVPYEAWLTSDGVRAELQAEAEASLHEFLWNSAISEELRRRLNVKLGYGELASVMAAELDNSGADLVVLGTHGRGGFSHATIGSNAESLLSWVPRDVLMVREIC